MNLARLYAAWGQSEREPVLAEMERRAGWDDPEVGINEYADLLSGFREYLEKNGKQLRENDLHIEHTDIGRMFSNITKKVYQVGDAIVFVRHASHEDDWPTLANPSRETLSVRVYTPQDPMPLVTDLRKHLEEYISEVSDQRVKSVSYWDLCRQD